jgi:phosphoenolpyruvate synthase/pyruvate phosphate dikinase
MFNEGNSNMRDLLGGKGANLAEMTNIGLPVPYGFTITTQACNDYYDNGKKISKEVESQIEEALAKLEEKNRQKVGRYGKPAARFRPLRLGFFDAGHDGYGVEPRHERPNGGSGRKING